MDCQFGGKCHPSSRVSKVIPGGNLLNHPVSIKVKTEKCGPISDTVVRCNAHKGIAGFEFNKTTSRWDAITEEVMRSLSV